MTLDQILAELEELRGQSNEEPELAAVSANELRELDSALRGVRAARVRQDVFTEQRVQATRDLKAELAKARDYATRVRYCIVYLFAKRPDRLRRFKKLPCRAGR